MEQAPAPITPSSLRLWPGVIAAVVLCVTRFAVPLLIPGSMIFGVMGGLVATFAIAVWWLFFSRAPWVERIGAVVITVVVLFAMSRVVHPSISGGMMGMMLPIFAVPVVGVALVIAVAAFRRSPAARRIAITAAILLGGGVFTILRTGGITGVGDSDFHWRWTQTPEERLLAGSGATGGDASRARPMQPASPASTLVAAAWPGFRGAERDGIVRGLRIDPDWTRSAPAELWRRPIGPGWSSFAVRGDVFYTQEQLGEEEVVSCYKLATGDLVWRHRDRVRFYESNGGPGPRGTPTVAGDRVYTFGATGVVNALSAADGTLTWSRNAAADTHTNVPMWGFSSSPLVLGDLVIVAASGQLIGYDRATGKPRWLGPAIGGSYSSPHQATIGGVTQILLLTTAGATSVVPSTGKVLWEHEWRTGGVPIVQPAMTSEGDVLISASSSAGAIGMRRLGVAHGTAGWTTDERWTSRGLKPYYNDTVAHQGHIYGFDGSTLACIGLKDGERKWKGGRYGNGQLVLLADQDVLLVLSEQGELALVAATPDEFKELSRRPAIKGKTWNHPVLAGELLLVRNGEEMAAFRLALAAR